MESFLKSAAHRDGDSDSTTTSDSESTTRLIGNGSLFVVDDDGDGTEETIAADDEFKMTVLSGAAGGVMVTVILGAVLGNLLVIVSVRRFERLRVVANSFIVSLAVADLLVAVFVMTFSALQHMAGRWLFGPVVCDIFNANDVLFSTASLLHLCCISVDRYLAVTDPFGYHRKMSRRRAVAMLAAVWTAAALLSHAPIHLGWYAVFESSNHTTALANVDERPWIQDRQDQLVSSSSSSSPLADLQPTVAVDYECLFEVNIVYGIVSSCVSFWTPAVVIVFAYVKIFREARRQQARIRSLTSTSSSTTPSHQHHHHNNQQQPRYQQQQQQQQKFRGDDGRNANGISAAMTPSTENDVESVTRMNDAAVGITSYPQKPELCSTNGAIVNGNQGDVYHLQPLTSSSTVQRQYSFSSRISSKVSLQFLHPHGNHHQQQQLAQQRRQLQRENKAARTLGIVVGAFIVCWLPFFTWYLTATLCRAAANDSCPLTPDAVVTTLFWIGYANSALNPIIYACFNRDFRNAFRRILGCRSRHGGSGGVGRGGVGGRSSTYSDGLSYRGETMPFGGQVCDGRSQADGCPGCGRCRCSAVWCCPSWYHRCRTHLTRRLSDSTVTGGCDGTASSSSPVAVARTGSGKATFYFATGSGRCGGSGGGGGWDAERRYEPIVTA